MPERGRTIVAGAALGLLVATVAAPAALAQVGGDRDQPTWEQRWATSALDGPFDEPGHTIRTDPFGVSGTMRYEKAGPTDQILQVQVRLVDDPGDDVTLPERCTVPLPAVATATTPQTERVAELPFAVELAGVPCNGAYRLEVEATLSDPDSPTYVLAQPVAVGLLPAGVTGLAVELDEEQRKATVTFTPLAPEERAPDAIGYVIERGGPATDTGAGEFVDVGTLGLEDEPRFVDDLARVPGGTYTYRVRATRAGAGEPERSSVIETETQTITIGDPPDQPPESVGPGRKSPRRGSAPVARRSQPTSTRRATTATTIDTGFEDTLDYGDRPRGELPDIPGDEPVAGRSVITEEDEGLDLAAPVAGALVLVGWAGHIAYLNRLAKHL